MTVWESRFAVWLTAVGTIKGRDNDKNIQKPTRFIAFPQGSRSLSTNRTSVVDSYAALGGGELVSHIFQSLIAIFFANHRVA
jgi:hypothetical protein